MGETSVDIWRGYDPLPAQTAFHTSTAKWRLYAGAVGAGKTKAGSREAIRTAIEMERSAGREPSLKTPVIWYHLVRLWF